LLLLILFAQASSTAARTSLTVDEGLHITSGYTILRTGDFRLIEEHPPLLKMIEALPLLLVADLPSPTTLRGWESPVPVTDSIRLVHAAEDLIYPYHPIDRLVFAARLPVALFAALLGAVVFRWATDLWGWKGGLMALFFLAFDPNIVAHASVATTDLGAACLVTLVLFLLARCVRHPTIPRFLWLGTALGLALGTKLSAAAVVPVVILIAIVALPRRKKAAALGSVLGVAFLVLWATYRFEVGSIPGVPFPVPMPSHIIPLSRLRLHMELGHSTFLLGENGMRGWWYYFPVAFVLKTPLPTLMMIAVASVAFIRGVRRTPSQEAVLWLFPLVYGGISLHSSLNIGYRHLLPILPLLFVFIARLAVPHSHQCTLRITHYASRIAFCIFLAWLVLGTVLLFPHYLAYFNELAGGADGGWRYLADSNTDWGQAYKDLARFQRERNLGPVWLAAFTLYDPAMYGVENKPLAPMVIAPPIFATPFDPPPGDYVISVTALDGIRLPYPEMYEWFRQHVPQARIGHVLFYYHVPEGRPLQWIAQCTTPAVSLSPPIVEEWFSATDMRQADFDCTSAWLYPGSGAPGVYGLHHALLPEKAHTFPSLLPSLPQATDPFVTRRLADLRPSFDMRRYTEQFPAFVLYEQEQPPQVPSPQPVVALPAADLPSAASPSQTTPLSLDGPLTFLGAVAYSDSDGLDVETWWRVTQAPGTRPFSIMGHLLTPQGEVLGVADGLGISPEMLEAGDILVQRHQFNSVAEGAALWLRTGAYWLDSMERWSVAGVPGADALFMPLEVRP
jgi:hypothetical protein